jgi:hypothetical protein
LPTFESIFLPLAGQLVKTSTSISLLQKNTTTPLKVGKKKKEINQLLEALDWAKQLIKNKA